MKNFLIRFILFVYVNYIQEDWDIYTKFGKICIYPAWFIHSILVWLISPIFLVEFWFKNSELYKEIQKIQKANGFKN